MGCQLISDFAGFVLFEQFKIYQIMENPINQTPLGVGKKSVYETENEAIVRGSPSFIVDAARALIQARQEIPLLDSEPIKISYNQWFNNAANLNVEEDEEFGEIFCFGTTNPSKDNFVGAFRFKKLQIDFNKTHETIIRTIISDLNSKIVQRNKTLAEPILNEKIQQCQNLCTALIRNTSIDTILTSPNIPTSFKELKKKGNWYDGISIMQSIQRCKFLIADNIHAIPETNNYDQFIGQGKTNLIQNSFKLFKECLRNPTENMVKKCTEAVIQIDGSTNGTESNSENLSMYR